MTDSLHEKIQQLALQRIQLINSLKNTLKGLDWCAEHTEIADKALRIIYAYVKEEYPELPPISIIAIGSYGRKEIAPYSDVDIAVIPYETTHLILDAPIRSLLHNIQTAFEEILEIKVSYSYLIVSDIAGFDDLELTRLIDSRLITGSPLPFGIFMQAFWKNFPTGDFLVAKVNNRKSSLRLYNDTPLVIEPNIEEGAGGLRSFQTANWINVVIHQQFTRPTQAYNEVIKLRNLMHYLSRRPCDILTRQVQKNIKELLNIDQSALISETLKSLYELQTYYQKTFEKLFEARYNLSDGVSALKGEIRVSSNISISEAAIGIAIGTQLGLKTSNTLISTQPEIESNNVLRAISYGEETLRNLDRCGILQQLLPELDACRTLVPEGDKHIFTVFEHTLRAIKCLDQLQPGENFAGNLKKNTGDISILYLAVLLHDVGKIEKQSTHFITGEKIALEVSRRWGLDSSRTEILTWLIREHHIMSRFINLRDVNHTDTAIEFANITLNQERLSLLTLLTWADCHTSSTSDWSLLKEKYLQKLYEATLKVIEKKSDASLNPTIYRQRIYHSIKNQNTCLNEIAEFVESLPAHYLLGTDPEQIEDIFHLSKKAAKSKISLQITHCDFNVTEVTICYPYHIKSLSWMLGVFYSLGINLQVLRSCTTQNKNPMSINAFTLTYGGLIVPHTLCSQIEPLLHLIFKQELSIDELLWEKGIDPGIKPHISRYRYQDGMPGILEIQAHEELGLAFRISRQIAQKGWNTHAVRLGTWAGHGAAAFYITGENFRMLTTKEVSEIIHGKPSPIGFNDLAG